MTETYGADDSKCLLEGELLPLIAVTTISVEVTPVMLAETAS